jgi:geranylgeranyl diphosphate synthase type II
MTDEAALERLAGADRAAVEARLRAWVDELASAHAGMRDAIAYSLLGGGKRLRPLLCLWTHDLFARLSPGAAPREAALDAACAVECVHTYSLIHDDLPCMDDDDLRRGRPSSHRRFGEATAVLAGDALLNMAYEIMVALPGRDDLGAAACLEATATLAASAGVGGLIAGQALDLEAPAGGGLPLVQRIHEHKTARLIAAAMEVGAIVAAADAAARARVRAAGLDAGRAFQIIDDLLDLEGSRESLGKTPRKDVKEGKLTFPSVVGADAARRRAGELVGAAMAALPEARGTHLEDMIRFIAGRSR